MKLGRVYGNMCEYDQAKEAFLLAIDRYSEAYEEGSPRLFPAYAELAQFSYDIGRYADAVTYFDRAFPLGLEVIEKADPPGYAAVMTDYADALERVGKPDEAAAALVKARDAAGGSVVRLAQGAEYVRYPKECGEGL